MRPRQIHPAREQQIPPAMRLPTGWGRSSLYVLRGGSVLLQGQIVQNDLEDLGRSEMDGFQISDASLLARIIHGAA